MISTLWRIGIISATVFFGVKIGLALGFSGLSRRWAILITCLYSFALLGLVILASKHLTSLYKIVNTYNYVVFIAMSVIIFWAGIHTLHEWKAHGRNSAGTTCIALAAPCPCCYASVIMAVALASPLLGVSTILLGKYTALILGVTILATYIFSGQIVKFSGKPYPILLGNLMLFLGFYFLVSAMVMPNMGSLQSLKMNSLNIPSIRVSLAGVAFVVFLGLLGFYKQKRKAY